MRWCAAPSRRAAAARAHCTTADAWSTPEASTVLFSIRARARVATPQTLLHVNTQSHERKAATAVIETEALVCSGSRCSSP